MPQPTNDKNMANPPTYFCPECQRRPPFTDPCANCTQLRGRDPLHPLTTVSGECGALAPSSVSGAGGSGAASAGECGALRLMDPEASARVAELEREARMLRERHDALITRCTRLENEADRIRTNVSALTRRFERREHESQPFGSVPREGYTIDPELPRPTRNDLERWGKTALDLPGPLGRALQILVAEVDRLDTLLRRVRCYAVVDAIGNPGPINAARMVGIERDIDDAVEGRPMRQDMFVMMGKR